MRSKEQAAPDRILTQVTGFFGVLALFLAAIGIYGVMAYSVSQRTQEIGVRMALGAKNRDVLSLIIRQGMGMVLGGMVVGIAGAVFMAKALAGFLVRSGGDGSGDLHGDVSGAGGSSSNRVRDPSVAGGKGGSGGSAAE